MRKPDWGDERLPERFWDKTLVEPNSGCWLWLANTSTSGYGKFKFRCVQWRAHRFSYKVLVAPLVAGMHIHHRCETKCCVNPAHLKQVTPQENTLASDTPARRNKLKTHCKHGHKFTEENTYRRYYRKGGGRQCKECTNAKA